MWHMLQQCALSLHEYRYLAVMLLSTLIALIYTLRSIYRIGAGDIGSISGGMPTWAIINLVIWTVISTCLVIGMLYFWEDSDNIDATDAEDSGVKALDQGREDGSGRSPCMSLMYVM